MEKLEGYAGDGVEGGGICEAFSLLLSFLKLI